MEALERKEACSFYQPIKKPRLHSSNTRRLPTVPRWQVLKDECLLFMALDDVSPCSHEEADTRMFVHAKDAVSNGSESVIIKVNDTDVVIAVYTLP